MKKKIIISILFVILFCIVLMLTGCKEAPIVTITSTEKTQTSISFDISISDTDNTCEIQKIELLHGEDDPIVAENASTREFKDLLSNNEYTILVTYTYKESVLPFETTAYTRMSVTTEKKNQPKVEFLDFELGMTDILFDYKVQDSDSTDCKLTKAEIYLGETKISEITSLINTKFDKLLSNTEYTIKLFYTYDLNDGAGVQNREISKKVTTKPIPEPVIILGISKTGDKNVKWNAEVKTSFTTYNFVKVELIYNGAVIAASYDNTYNTFNDLVENRIYKLKVYYTYETNSSEGSRELSQEKEFRAGIFTSKVDINKDWAGQTLLVAATAWSGSPGAPWSTMEIVVKEGEASGWGEKIDAAVLERTAFIKETYGVDVIWECASRYNTHDVLKKAILSGNDPDYDLAMPRAFRAQSIVTNGSVYDMAGREYIEFNNLYYNDLSVKTYTAKGHTFFITGDFANLDKETTFVLYFNKTLLGGKQATDKLYQMVRDGKWTFDQLVSLANSSYKDDGDGKHGDTDTYGLSTTSLTRFYEYFGVTQAGVDASTGEWKITLNDPKVNDIVSAIITANTANWARSAWGGTYGSNAQQALADGRLLFYNEVIQHIAHVAHIGNLGIVPFPMLNEEQGRYYAPCAGQYITLMCVPKTTSDRNMSDYFVDVLAWTGREYVMEAYYENMASKVDSAVEMEMILNYIMPNITYDAGNAVGWDTLMGGVLSASYNGNVNNFAQAYANAEGNALKTIKSWNDAWASYSE